ncbi:hypothetical protein ACF08N_37895 [Streptomyces sp. NPDC015127]|uniref:hypothetical protein n=1 Tax=Streptomyces sp. NPDC015127 TaxID=3364939 RepID=UPI0036F90C17
MTKDVAGKILPGRGVTQDFYLGKYCNRIETGRENSRDIATGERLQVGGTESLERKGRASAVYVEKILSDADSRGHLYLD